MSQDDWNDGFIMGIVAGNSSGGVGGNDGVLSLPDLNPITRYQLVTPYHLPAWTKIA